MDINTQRMFEELANNNLNESRKYLKLILENDNKKCNESIKRRLLPKLNTKTINLPSSIKDLINYEDVNNYFVDNRYVITEKDKSVVKKILDTWNVRDKLAEYKINYVNSLMLYGASGCGKTMFGRYIAYKTELPFLCLNFSNLISSYLGKTGENLQKIFDYVNKNNCVLMLDEIDAIGLTRGRESEVGEMSRIVINLMQCLDKVNTNSIIIASTNRIDMIDNALKRRFSLKYKMQEPTEEVKIEILKSYLNTIPGKYIDEYNDEILKEFVKDKKSCSDLVTELVKIIVECLSEDKKIVLKTN